MIKALLLSVLTLLAAQPVFGFVLENQAWTLDRTVHIQLTLGPARPLSDGFTSFNKSAEDVLNTWNEHLSHLVLKSVLASPVVPAGDDEENSAAFSSTIFGDTFGSGVLAVTILSSRNGLTEESDTLFNSAFSWDSYDGALRPSLQDFHRVALHEFGHMLGLDHPDEAGQTVAAIMNSHVSDLDVLTADDIAGVKSLYNNGLAFRDGGNTSVLANISTRGLVGTGDNVLIGGFIIQGTSPVTVVLRAIGFSLTALGVPGALHDPLLTVYDSNNQQIAQNDDWFTASNGELIGSYHLDPPNSIESALYLTLQPGSYTAILSSFSNSNQPAETGVGLFELYDLQLDGQTGRADNISTRGQVLGGDNVLIGGFIIGGAEAKPVVVRAIGPSLADQNVANALTDPSLDLRDGNGNLVQTNDNWGDGPDASAIEAEGFAPTRAKESALQGTLNPGSYTVVVSGVNGATGIGLVEVYDMSPL